MTRVVVVGNKAPPACQTQFPTKLYIRVFCDRSANAAGTAEGTHVSVSADLQWEGPQGNRNGKPFPLIPKCWPRSSAPRRLAGSLLGQCSSRRAVPNSSSVFHQLSVHRQPLQTLHYLPQSGTLTCRPLRVTAAATEAAAPTAAVPKRSSRSRSGKSAAALKDSSTFEACMQLMLQLMLQLAANPASTSTSTTSSSNTSSNTTTSSTSSTSSTPESDVEKAIAHLKQQQKSDSDQWLLVQCGDWLCHPRGWCGPAIAILQIWKLQCQLYDYTLWVVGPSGLPTGDTYFSGSELEKLTDRLGWKKFKHSFKVLAAGRGFDDCTRLSTWIKDALGETAKLAPKDQPSRHWKEQPPVQATRRAAAAAEHNSAAAAFRAAALAAAASGRSPGSAAAAEAPARRRSASAAATAAAGRPPVYLVPSPPGPGPVTLSMDYVTVRRRDNLIRDIVRGKTDMSETHIPLSALLAVSQAQSVMLQAPEGCAAAAAAAATAAAAGQQQLYSLEQLQQQAEAAEAALTAGAELSDSHMPCIPDPNTPFTLTMMNAADGCEYVVAHYEPHAFKAGQHAALADLLCDIYHNRHNRMKMSRVSAPPNERMVMAGCRVPRVSFDAAGNLTAHFGRYPGDEGPEADKFSLTAWPSLMTAGSLPAISGFWAPKVADAVCATNQQAAADAANTGCSSNGSNGNGNGSTTTSSSSRKKIRRGSPANFPSPCLLGSPFTTLAVTQNYHSLLHAEPGEHPFSFITWLDVLSNGAEMEVGYFWLTAALAFTPLPGSALYIDVRLVPHRSDPCIVRHSTYRQEGRYGAALFIKPDVIKMNAQLWAEFDWSLAQQRMQGLGSSAVRW